MSKRATATPPVLPGYSYIRPLGSGGFADVFLFEQDMPRRVVAVKVLVDDAINPEVLKTFNAEADILARLSSHPSIVSIYQASISADGRPYFVMEYCPDNMSNRYKKAPLPLPDVLDAGVRIASALETAHRSGVLHRDIKPSNVLVTTMGGPVLADFGIAASSAPRGDQPSVFAMSVPWSSPEVLREVDAGSVATEIWSLGATLYTLLAGRAPFEPSTGERLPREQLKQRTLKSKYTPTGRQDLGARGEAMLARCLDKDPSQRFGSMIELAEELRWIQYEMGMSPTALDVASAEWAAAAAPVDFDAQVHRGPVITTVNPQSRRAARAEHLASTQRQQAASEPRERVGGNRAVLWGAIGGAAGAAALVLGVLALAGVL